MKPSTKRKIRKLLSPLRRIGLKNTDFTIISNNCWGGVVYDILGLKYNSPTIGCFIMPDDYLCFINDLKSYLEMPLIKIGKEKSKHYNYIKDIIPDNCVIGKLGNIEIFFLHYKSFEDAKNKFERRSKRVNYENILIKFSDQNCFKPDYFYKFEKINFKNKIFITTNDSYISENIHVVKIPDIENVGYAKDDIKPSLKKIHIRNLFNSLDR